MLVDAPLALDVDEVRVSRRVQGPRQHLLVGAPGMVVVAVELLDDGVEDHVTLDGFRALHHVRFSVVHRGALARCEAALVVREIENGVPHELGRSRHVAHRRAAAAAGAHFSLREHHFLAFLEVVLLLGREFNAVVSLRKGQQLRPLAAPGLRRRYRGDRSLANSGADHESSAERQQLRHQAPQQSLLLVLWLAGDGAAGARGSHRRRS
mmetsp:Transcript_1025/g.2934  ORF Transcript_1025/g.2934 Transcript_1025/m.2934 type:complete len:209 (+) Transcript_1025:562-1188(+)